MSRSEGNIGKDGAQPVDASDIFEALTAQHGEEATGRKSAVSCYLSASEGWEEASSLLRGAFAAKQDWLRADKED